MNFRVMKVSTTMGNDDEHSQGTPDRDDVPDDYFDQYFNAEVILPKGDRMLTGTVKRRKVFLLDTIISIHYLTPARIWSNSRMGLSWSTQPAL
jgi:hypothetical protein